ncbi:unnamed protein product [Rotaria sp. Silwood1]|nr:unnamed protein product [Rotaria sp. Silwood1]CAF1598727.1 unnamed protein product [Rotaria sp. Silwood1]CAF1598860.1 unnamed protein product [Rotaria sp. Silwood1]CAF3723871.1 unnamed protein product [Rotaria sp. Silwood1]CAF3830889.1 unnamed protein product [Rotaria sp. Silwood1]
MFTTLLILACCHSLIGSLSIDGSLTQKYIDGTQYTIKNIGATYTQHVSNDGLCRVKLDNESKMLNEGEIIKIKNKWFKVEECQLNRAYPVECGSKLFYQLRDLSCSFIEEHNHDKKNLHQQQTTNHLMELLDRSYYNACCRTACTIYEFIQSCPT